MWKSWVLTQQPHLSIPETLYKSSKKAVGEEKFVASRSKIIAAVSRISPGYGAYYRIFQG